jgi:hypothetical protein
MCACTYNKGVYNPNNQGEGTRFQMRRSFLISLF